MRAAVDERDRRPITRPSSRSGTSSWAAELISTHDEPWPTPAHEPGGQRDRQRARDGEQPYAGQVERPGEHARARLAPDRPARQRGAGADRPERVRRRDEREAAGAESERRAHELRHADDPRPGRERDRDPEHDDRRGEHRAAAAARRSPREILGRSPSGSADRPVVRTPSRNTAETKNDAALSAKNALIGRHDEQRGRRAPSRRPRARPPSPARARSPAARCGGRRAPASARRTPDRSSSSPP